MNEGQQLVAKRHTNHQNGSFNHVRMQRRSDVTRGDEKILYRLGRQLTELNDEENVATLMSKFSGLFTTKTEVDGKCVERVLSLSVASTPCRL